MHNQDPPRLSWLGAKTFKQTNGGRKNAPGRSFEHNEALSENGSRTFAAEIDKVQTSIRADNFVSLADQVKGDHAINEALAEKGLYVDYDAIKQVAEEMRSESGF